MSEKQPNPGSSEAVNRGCTCPLFDNVHGEGRNGNFWVNSDCPLHGVEAGRAALEQASGPEAMSEESY